MLWGRARLTELFAPHALSVRAAQRCYVFHYRLPKHWLEVLWTYNSPVPKAFAAFEAPAVSAPKRDLLALIVRFSRPGDGLVVGPSEYLEIVVTRN